MLSFLTLGGARLHRRPDPDARTMPIITSRHNAIVARYRAAAVRDAQGAMLLDGAHLVADALAARVRIREAAITAERDDDPLARGLRASAIDVIVVSDAVMRALSPVRTASGIVALADRPAPPDALLYAPSPALVVLALDIQDPGNLGAIVRAAEAAGATGVVAAGACADPFGWKALRGSMGSALRLPIAIATDAMSAVTGARRHGCRLIASAPRGGRPFVGVDLTGPSALVIGAEGAGVPTPILDGADERVSIPMREPVESLNTAVAAALLLYEARRQRAPEAASAG